MARGGGLGGQLIGIYWRGPTFIWVLGLKYLGFEGAVWSLWAWSVWDRGDDSMPKTTWTFSLHFHAIASSNAYTTLLAILLYICFSP